MLLLMGYGPFMVVVVIACQVVLHSAVAVVAAVVAVAVVSVCC